MGDGVPRWERRILQVLDWSVRKESLEVKDFQASRFAWRMTVEQLRDTERYACLCSSSMCACVYAVLRACTAASTSGVHQGLNFVLLPLGIAFLAACRRQVLICFSAVSTVCVVISKDCCTSSRCFWKSFQSAFLYKKLN